MKLPIVGYRLWLANDDDHTLNSLTEPVKWPVGATVESDRIPDDDIPVGQPGIHWFSRFDLGEADYDLRPSHQLWFSHRKHFAEVHGIETAHWVAGAVVVWGRTVLHEFGGRSQYARLVALHYAPGRSDEVRAMGYDEYDGTKPPPALRTIAAKYGVPLCQSHAHLRAAALEHGREVRAKDLVA